VHDPRNDITRLLSFLCDVLRLLSNLPALRLRATALADVVNGVLRAQAHVYAARGARVIVDVPADLPHTQVDPEKLTQVVRTFAIL
jgi:signal transduction histidine kinase